LQATTDETKKLLTAKTDEALADGSFGLPWYAGESEPPFCLSNFLLTAVATNAKGEKECYWGFDHLAQVASHLGLKRPISGNSRERGWQAML